MAVSELNAKGHKMQRTMPACSGKCECSCKGKEPNKLANV